VSTWAAMLVVCRGISLGGPGASHADALDLTVSPGEVCTIVGSSGSGKTRLCRLLSGTEQSVRGEITVDGRNVAGHPREIRQRVTHVVPEAPVWPSRSTVSSVEYVLRLCGLPKPSDDDSVEALRLAEVPDRLIDASSRTLNQFQRFGVWLAIHRLRRAPVLLMDDPFVRLTGSETENLARLIQEAVERGGCAVITSGSADVPDVVAGHRYRIARGQLMPIKVPTSWIDGDTDITRLLPSDLKS
jgi:ABC-type multidrug transport system ATPase subunit